MGFLNEHSFYSEKKARTSCVRATRACLTSVWKLHPNPIFVFYEFTGSGRVGSFIPIFKFIDTHQQFHHYFVSFIQLNVKTLSFNNSWSF